MLDRPRPRPGLARRPAHRAQCQQCRHASWRHGSHRWSSASCSVCRHIVHIVYIVYGLLCVACAHLPCLVAHCCWFPIAPSPCSASVRGPWPPGKEQLPVTYYNMQMDLDGAHLRRDASAGHALVHVQVHFRSYAAWSKRSLLVPRCFHSRCTRYMAPIALYLLQRQRQHRLGKYVVGVHPTASIDCLTVSDPPPWTTTLQQGKTANK